MSRAARRVLLTLMVLLLPAWQAQAGWDEARAALKAGKTGAAFRELKPMAEEGDKEAQYMIAYLLSTGNGVKQNNREAYMWYTIAVARGHTAANAARSYVRKKLNFAEAAEADREARQWLKTFAVDDAKEHAEEQRKQIKAHENREEQARKAAREAGKKFDKDSTDEEGSSEETGSKAGSD